MALHGHMHIGIRGEGFDMFHISVKHHGIHSYPIMYVRYFHSPNIDASFRTRGFSAARVGLTVRRRFAPAAVD